MSLKRLAKVLVGATAVVFALDHLSSKVSPKLFWWFLLVTGAVFTLAHLIPLLQDLTARNSEAQ